MFHVLNRGVGRRTLFASTADYAAFERVLEETLEVRPMRICAYGWMPNHWHFLLWPERDGDLAALMQQLTVTHVTRWSRAKHRVGLGHVYQGRYKSFPVQDDDPFVQVARYVERNALRAGLCPPAERLRWGSLWRVYEGNPCQKRLLSSWPLARPRRWRDHGNGPQSDEEVEAIRRSVVQGRPRGQANWVQRMAKRLGLEHTLRDRGRPPKNGPPLTANDYR